MALTIEQEPLYTLNTVGQEVIFTVLDAATVSTYFNVKYVAQVHIGTDAINLTTSTAIGTFKTHPLHLVDKYSLNDNVLRYLKIRFKVQGSTTATGNSVIIGASADSVEFTLFNGYLKHTDLLIRDVDGNFGFNTSIFNLNEFVLPLDIVGEYLTNAPLTQYANDKDYGTISFISTEVGSDGILNRMKVKYYDSLGIGILIL